VSSLRDRATADRTAVVAINGSDDPDHFVAFASRRFVHYVKLSIVTSANTQGIVFALILAFDRAPEVQMRHSAISALYTTNRV
jgi:hypothetical protein